MSIFLDAISVLEERGWHQGNATGDDGSVCIMHAIAAACSPQSPGGAWRVVDLLATHNNAINFNDDPHTTYEDVVLLLKFAHEESESA